MRALFVKYKVEQNEELLNLLAQMLGTADLKARAANEAVNEFGARFGSGEMIEEIELQDIHALQSKVYSIVWQDNLEK